MVLDALRGWALAGVLMANMVAFQHGYNANARMISTFDKMLETIIGLGRG